MFSNYIIFKYNLTLNRLKYALSLIVSKTYYSYIDIYCILNNISDLFSVVKTTVRKLRIFILFACNSTKYDKKKQNSVI